MAFPALSSQAGLFIRFRFAAFELAASVPHLLSNCRMAQASAGPLVGFIWLELIVPYFNLLTVLAAVLVAHGLAWPIRSGMLVHSFSLCCFGASRPCAPPLVEIPHGSGICWLYLASLDLTVAYYHY